MKNIEDIKNRYEAKQFAEKGLKELKILFSDPLSQINGEWNKYTSDIKNLNNRFAFNYNFYLGESIKLLSRYNQELNNESLQHHEEVLKRSRELREKYEEGLSSEYGH